MNKPRGLGFHVGVFASFFLFCCFGSTLNLVTASPPPPHHDDKHDYTCFQAERPIDIVLSHYKEDLNSVRSKLERLQNHPFVDSRACVHVYTKSSSSNSMALIDAAGLNETVIVKTRNMGRESGAYLQYLLSNYHNLPRHVLFLQADVEDIDNVLDKLNQATKQTGFLGLGIWGKCNCDNCNVISGKLVRIREIWALATGTFCLRDFQANFRGQMLVSKERVQRHPAKLYLMLLRSLYAMPGHALHGDLRYIDESDFSRDIHRAVGIQGAHDSLFGHVMERMWSVIFDCFGEEAHNGCLD
jgi:Protein of unknown function (DUF3431)